MAWRERNVRNPMKTLIKLNDYLLKFNIEMF